MEGVKPEYRTLLDNLAESIRVQRRGEFLLQLSQVDTQAFIPQPATSPEAFVVNA